MSIHHFQTLKLRFLKIKHTTER